MENVTKFLESSTIHGFAYIATGSKNVRMFWILVIMGGFSAAAILIHTAFQSWDESPVKTTIETLPIKKITFPKVTVCPPKNTYTDLNHDLIMAERITLDNDTRNELANFAVELLYDQLHETMMRNMSKLEDNDRYYNWYHGYTKIELPYIDYFGHVDYTVHTAASSGTISTQHLGEEFDADKVETSLVYSVYVYPPDSVRNKNNTNVTLHFNIKKLSLKDLSGEERLLVTGLGFINVDRTYHHHHYSLSNGGCSDNCYIQFTRNVIPGDVRKQKLRLMPGFRFTWYYSGMEVESEARFYNDTTAFVRNGSIFIRMVLVVIIIFSDLQTS